MTEANKAADNAAEKVIEVVEEITNWNYVVAALVVGAVAAAVVMFLVLDYASKDDRSEPGHFAQSQQPQYTPPTDE